MIPGPVLGLISKIDKKLQKIFLEVFWTERRRKILIADLESAKKLYLGTYNSKFEEKGSYSDKIGLGF